MKTSLRIILAISITTLLASCYPEERFWWSPQGDRALVLLEDGMHLADANGKLGPPLDGTTSKSDGVASVSWLPDGNSFVCERGRTVKSWDEVVKVAPAQEIKEVDDLMPAIMPLLEATTKIATGAEKLDQLVAAVPEEWRARLAPAFMRAYASHPAEVEKLVSALPKADEIITQLREDGSTFHLDEQCVIKLKDGRIDSTRVIATTFLSWRMFPKASPKHPVVASISTSEGSDTATLEVRSLNGGPALVISQRATGAFDWTSDGRSVVFTSPLGGKDSKLMSIHRLTVVQESGALMKEPYDKQPDGSNLQVEGPDRVGSPQLLATVVSLSQPRVQALADGRVLVASHPITLPSSGTEPQREPQLYLITADGSAIQRVPTAPGELPSDLSVFVASPDGKRVAIIESETDAVAVVELSTGKTQIVSPAHEQWKCETVPAWRTNTDLTFAALHGSDPKPQWMVWTEGKGLRSLSEGWPADSTVKWLEHRKGSQPEKP